MKIINCIIFCLFIFLSYSQKKYQYTKIIFKEDSTAYLKNGKLVNGFILKEGNGLEIGAYINGLKEGEYNFYKKGVLISTINYKNGKKNGLFTNWDESHTFINFQRNFQNGFREGKSVTYYPKSNKINETIDYLKGNAHGLRTIYLEDGTKQSETYYLNGKLDGLSTYYYKNGNSYVKMNHKEGRWFGFISFYSANGSITLHEFIGMNEVTEIRPTDNNVWIFREYGKELWKYTTNKDGILIKTEYLLPNYIVGEGIVENGVGKITLEYDKDKDKPKLENIYSHNKQTGKLTSIKRWYSNGQEKEIYTNEFNYYGNSSEKASDDKKWYSNGILKYEFKKDSSIIRYWYESGKLKIDSRSSDWNKGYFKEFYENGQVKISIGFNIELYNHDYDYVDFQIFDNQGHLLFDYNDTLQINKPFSYNEKIISINQASCYGNSFCETFEIKQYKDSLSFLENSYLSKSFSFQDIGSFLREMRGPQYVWESEGDFILNYFPAYEFGSYKNGLKDGTWITQSSDVNDWIGHGITNIHNVIGYANYTNGKKDGYFITKDVGHEIIPQVSSWELFQHDQNDEYIIDGFFKDDKIVGFISINAIADDDSDNKGETYKKKICEISQDDDKNYIVNRFNFDGKKELTKNFQDSKIIMETTYYSSEKKESVTEFSNGKYIDGRKQGQVQKFYENGNLKSQEYFNDKYLEAKDSLCKYYHENGNVKNIVFYKGKKVIQSDLFDESGTEIKTVKIGNQIWMSKNLNVDKFLNGKPIPQAKTNMEWENAFIKQNPAWCYFKNDSTKSQGIKLYNYYVISDNIGITPDGWHIPTYDEMMILTKFLGGAKVAGKKLKSESFWAPGKIGTNESLFNGLPSGYRSSYGSFEHEKGEFGAIWTTSYADGWRIYGFKLSNDYDGVGFENFQTGDGISIRLIKNQ